MNEFITVLSAELMRRMQSRAFKIGLVLGMVAVALIIKAPQFIGNALSASSDTIVLAGPADLTSTASKLLAKDFTIAAVTTDTAAPTTAYLDAHKKAGALVAVEHAANGIKATVYARDLTSISHTRLNGDLMPLNLALGTGSNQTVIDKYMEVPIAVHGIGTKFANEQASKAAEGIAYTLLTFLYISILLNSQLLMTSVAEEKTSRIAELLISSVSPTALLAGKIVAAAILGVAQMASWLVVGYLLTAFGGGAHTTPATAHGPDAAAGMGAMIAGGVSMGDILAFAAFFIIGYLQLSTMFAALASTINRTEDIGSLSTPLVMPVVGAFLVAMFALGFPNNAFVVATSFIPLFAPFTMFARIAVSVVPIWQIALSLAINIAAVVLIAIAAGKIYRVGMMMYGRPPKFSQIWTTLRS